jgi:dTDP-4-amino-4,6-dideoxygalactose transaminase
MIRLTRPFFDDTEHAAVQRVLASGMLVQGDEVRGFEDDVARFLDARAPGLGPVCVAAVNTGTIALEIALTVSGVRFGDEVVVPALTWPSPGNAVVLRGATPVLVDVDPHTFNLDPHRVAEVLTPNTRAIIAVDQFGVPADVPALRRLAGDVPVIEDAACALGSTLHGRPCALLGDMGTLSFHPRKVITTGEGGMICTRERRQYDSCRALRNHGQDEPGVFRTAGPNARMSEIHAAIGRAQIAKLETILARRRSMADEIRAAVSLAWQRAPGDAVVNHQTLGFVLPTPPNGGTRAEGRNALLAAMRSEAIEAGALSHALHRLPQFARNAVNVGRGFPVADMIADGGVAVPLHPGMDARDVATVIDALRRHADWAVGRDPLPA